MRLLSANADGSLSLTHFSGNDIPRYAILSHTWEADDQEVIFHDLKFGKGKDKNGYRKIQFCGDQAKKDGLQYFWVDSCCIDKTSSTELTEAINSMFKWYAEAEVCYAYLSDLVPNEYAGAEQVESVWGLEHCRWFQRGWTLQELIAPKTLEFYDRNWSFCGTKSSLRQELSNITGIDIEILEHTSSLSNIPIAQKMSWAASRQTTRVEDMAYSLLGIFGVHMPLVYGEGPNAFVRLQEEISKETNDLSLFAWRAETFSGQKYRGVFANSPAEFRSSRFVRFNGDPWFSEEFTITNKGLRIKANWGIEPDDTDIRPDDTDIMLLNCSQPGVDSERNKHIGIYLRKHLGGVFTRARPDEFAIWDMSGSNTFEETIYIAKRVDAVRSANLERSHRGAFVMGEGFAFLRDGLSKYFKLPVIEPQSHWDGRRDLLYAGGITLFTATAFFVPRWNQPAKDVRAESSFMVVFGNSADIKQRPWLTVAAWNGPNSDLMNLKENLMELGQDAITRKEQTLLLKDTQGRDFITFSVELGDDILDGEPVFCVEMKHKYLHRG